MLDSVQGRAPVAAFGSIVSLPGLEAWIQTWTFNETIHSDRIHISFVMYIPILLLFLTVLSIKRKIVDCANDITVQYDLITKVNLFNVLGEGKAYGKRRNNYCF